MIRENDEICNFLDRSRKLSIFYKAVKMYQEQFPWIVINILLTSLYNVHISVNFQITNIQVQKIEPGVCSFCRNLAKLYRASDFTENVLDSFSCFYIEITYSNFTSCGTYMLSILVCHIISVKRAHSSYTTFLIKLTIYFLCISVSSSICESGSFSSKLESRVLFI